MSQNIGGMAPFMNNMPPRGQNPMYYPPCPGMEPHPHMARPPYFPDDKMNHCSSAALSQQHMRFRMGMGEFKAPMMNTPVEPPPPAKKKRRTSNNNTSVNHQPPPPPVMQDLAPPPPTGYGDTIVASNPFDDSPTSHSMMVSPRHMGCGPPMMLGGGSCGMGSPMGCGPPMSPMGGMCGGGQARSPMCAGPPQLICGTPGSPLHRGSPLVDCMGPSRKSSPMMGPPCGSPMDSPNGPLDRNCPVNNGPQNTLQQCNIQSDMCKSVVVSCNGGTVVSGRSPAMVSGPQAPPPGHPPSGMPPAGMHPMAMHHPPHGYPPPKPMPVSAGKVYPVDQPMVFNPQNPNAPPIYPCGVCHKEVHDNDQAILCESGCNFWFHRICTGLTEAAYQLLTAEVYAEWVCDKCLSTKNIPLVKLKP